MSEMVERARMELTKAGLFDDDSDYNGLIGHSVMELVDVFSMQGHSGYSAGMVSELFNSLVRGEAIGPLTDDPEEWYEHPKAHWNGVNSIWQNKRQGDSFSEDGGKTYYRTSEVESGQPRVYHNSKKVANV